MYSLGLGGGSVYLYVFQMHIFEMCVYSLDLGVVR